MKKSRWFVMLRNGIVPVPLVDGDGDVWLFASESEAFEIARTNPLGRAYGCRVYEW